MQSTEQALHLPQVDVFALGVILNECCTRRQPWKESSHFFQIILKVNILLHCPNGVQCIETHTHCWNHEAMGVQVLATPWEYRDSMEV